MSAVYSDFIIILRRARFSETSLLLTCLTQSHGKVKISARGALRPHSSLSGRLDLWHLTRAVWVPSRKGEVHALREAEIIVPFQPAEPAHVVLLVAAYFSALAELVSTPGEAQPEVFHLLQRALQYLTRQKPDQRAVIHFERQLAHILGILDPSSQDPAQLLRSYIGKLPDLREEIWPQLATKSSQ